jgi:two-component system, NtrC family, response regulator HydG
MSAIAPRLPVINRSHAYYGMIGAGAAMQQVFATIERVAPFIRSTLISGETGTGKELVARALHKAGRRSKRRFVTINCSTLVETLFESELFGHARGAFTGATVKKPGLFDMADGGVIFLDEVGELPLTVQAKLLRVLEAGEIQSVGGLEPHQVDVQVIAATNRDLHIEVASGRFRTDLFYRLNVVEIRLPALRHRREDISPLADSFLADWSASWNTPLKKLTDGARATLREAPWEGNIRELHSVIQRACMLSDSPLIDEQLLAGCLPGITLTAAAAAIVPVLASPVSHVAEVTADDIEPAMLSVVERAHILRVLHRASGNKKSAARKLGVSRRTLYRHLERLGLQSEITRRAHVQPSHNGHSSPPARRGSA